MFKGFVFNLDKGLRRRYTRSPYDHALNSLLHLLDLLHVALSICSMYCWTTAQQPAATVQELLSLLILFRFFLGRSKTLVLFFF
jgi:hypothetical protein